MASFYEKLQLVYDNDHKSLVRNMLIGLGTLSLGSYVGNFVFETAFSLVAGLAFGIFFIKDGINYKRRRAKSQEVI